MLQERDGASIFSRQSTREEKKGAREFFSIFTNTSNFVSLKEGEKNTQETKQESTKPAASVCIRAVAILTTAKTAVTRAKKQKQKTRIFALLPSRLLFSLPSLSPLFSVSLLPYRPPSRAPAQMQKNTRNQKINKEKETISKGDHE